MNIKKLPGILVTGGKGLLGKSVCQLLDVQEIPYLYSTHSIVEPIDNAIIFDLTNSSSIDPDLWGVDIIIHLASDKKHPDNDVLGTVSLLNTIKNCKRDIHLIYISIVGTADIPMTYFNQKAETERKIINSGVKYSILRATQFYEYVSEVVNMLSIIPFISFIPKKVPIQPIDKNIVAEKIVELSKEAATMKIEDIGGNKIMSFEDAASDLFKKQGKTKLILNFPLWGAMGNNLKRGLLTSKIHVNGGLTWEEWLSQI